MLHRIRSIAATSAYRLFSLALIGIAFGGMYYLPTRNLLALKIPVYIALSAGVCAVITLFCDLLAAGERAMSDSDSNSITEVTGERLR
ncbi:hypothetical protein ACFFQF_07920 [Haladaptatus pallidirubidus]|uniref:Uncharacterized protein n=1 Tax=Haladaptatus pallidirubidus TaxID=1008152 RepID=A0AAV3UG53_9EURY|nr:hypothetical protein [Haladaptatus pallidirubidus]